MLFQRAANTCSGEADCRSGNGGASFGLEGRHLLDDLLVRIGEWHVFAFGMLQQRHHRDGKSANGCGDGPFPGVFAPTLGDAQTLELQVGHVDAVPERHLRGLRQECSKKRRAGFRDRQLLVDVAGLVLSRDEPEVRTDVTRLGEPRVVAAEDGDVGDRAEEAYADHLADALYVGGEFGGVGEFTHLLFDGGDLHVNGLEHAHQRPADGLEVPWPAGAVDQMEIRRVLLRDAESHRLGEPAHFVDELRARRHERKARLKEADHLLMRLRAEEDGVEHLDVCERVPRQLPSVVPIVLGVRMRQRAKLGGIGDVDLESHAADELCHPPAMGARLERHGRLAVFRRKILRERLFRSRHGRLLDDPALSGDFRHDADFRRFVAHVDADCGIILHCSPSLGYVVCLCTSLWKSAAVKNIIADPPRDCLCLEKTCERPQGVRKLDSAHDARLVNMRPKRSPSKGAAKGRMFTSRPCMLPVVKEQYRSLVRLQKLFSLYLHVLHGQKQRPKQRRETNHPLTQKPNPKGDCKCQRETRFLNWELAVQRYRNGGSQGGKCHEEPGPVLPDNG